MSIKIPIDEIKGINWNKPHEDDTKRIGSLEIRNVSSWSNIDYGLNKIQVDNLRDEVIVTTSAKILKDNYKQSISLNTIEQFTEEINKHDIIKLDAGAILNAMVLRCDPVNTIRVDDLRRSINSVLQYANMNSKYDVDPYLVKGSLGYSANRKVKSYKERQIGYSKPHDLKKDKHNRAFSNKYPNMVKSFGINDMRIESNFVSFKMMKDKFAVANNNLGSILNSTKNVNYQIFNRIINTGVQMELFSDHFISMDINKLVKEYGYGQIFKMFEYDWNRIENWIKIKYPRTKTRNSAYYQINLFKEAFARQQENEVHINTDIQQVQELLRVA